MSIEAMDWAKRQKCGCPSTKAILMEIANWTNPEGRAEFRVVAEIAKVVEMSARNVQRHLVKLETPRDNGGLGLLKRVPVFGKNGVQRANGFVLVGFRGRVTNCHPQTQAEEHGKGDRLSPTGATNCHGEGDTGVTGEGDTSVTPYLELDLDKEKSPPTPRRGEERVRKTFPISINWACPAMVALPPEIGALAAQWPQGAYHAEGAAFAQYWRGNGRRRADWDAQWAARVQARHAAVMRDAKAGVVFGKATAAAGAADRTPVAARRREDSRSAELHELLAGTINTADYDSWFGQAALVFEDCGLIVVAPSRFVAAEIEKRHGRDIETALGALGRGVDWTRFVAEAGTAPAVAAKGGKRRG